MFAWPCLLQAVLSNVTFHYPNPSALDTCEQFTERTVFSLKQSFPSAKADRITPVSFHLDVLQVEVQVVDGSDNSTGRYACPPGRYGLLSSLVSELHVHLV
jgi:hypothetical protein